MDRERPDTIGRLYALQRNPQFYKSEERVNAIIEAILDLDGRFRTHTHTKESP